MSALLVGERQDCSCQPGCAISGTTVAWHHAIVHAHALERVDMLTIADPLPRLAGHLVADQGALSKPMLHVTVVE
jgi:hypothetical protein